MKRRKKKVGSKVVHPNVSRIDYPGLHGYTVRFARDGKEVSKYFSDTVYGVRKGKLAAISWREETIKQIGEAVPRGNHGVPAKPPGYSTIKRQLCPLNINGELRKVLCWVGFLRIEDRRHLSTKWSINKWGERKAKKGVEAWLVKKKAELAARLGKSGGSHSDAPTEVERSAPPPAPPELTPPAPKSRATQLEFQACTSCGGVVRLMKGPGRTYLYRGRRVRIPEDFPTETCVGCGEIYMSDRETIALEERIVVKVPSKKRRRA